MPILQSHTRLSQILGSRYFAIIRMAKHEACYSTQAEYEDHLEHEERARRILQVCAKLADFPAVFFQLCHETQQMKIQVQISLVGQSTNCYPKVCVFHKNIEVLISFPHQILKRNKQRSERALKSTIVAFFSPPHLHSFLLVAINTLHCVFVANNWMTSGFVSDFLCKEKGT